MSTGIKPIETRYKGYRFRSRLEARWAVFFDGMRVPYSYEPEGFELEDGTPYLPDFWLPDQDCWVEIKGKEPTAKEQAMCEQLCRGTGKNVFLFSDNIFVPEAFGLHAPCAQVWFPPDGWDDSYMWCICHDCRSIGLEFEGRSDRLPCKLCRICWYVDRNGPYESTWPETSQGQCPNHGAGRSGCRLSSGDRGHNATDPFIVACYEAAVGARFEHGEAP